MVEEVLSNSKEILNREELKRRLPKKIMHQTLNVILDYLVDSGKILDSDNGIIWIFELNTHLFV